MHCVFPKDKGQILGAKSHDTAHYQLFYADFKEAISNYDAEIEANVYFPDAINDLLLVNYQFCKKMTTKG
jgi:hypothetical protein